MQRLSVNKRRYSLFANKPVPLLSQIKNQNGFHKTIQGNSIEILSDNAKEEPRNKKQHRLVKFENNEPPIDFEFPRIISLSSSRHVLTEDFSVQPLQNLPFPANSPSFSKVFFEKINICKIIFNFSKKNFQLKAKKEKKKALIELNVLLANRNDAILLNEEMKNEILNIINVNIFEQDPFTTAEKILSTTIETTFEESSWDHMFIVYKILNQFLILFPEKVGFEYLKKAVKLLNIPDTNEREMLVTFIKNYMKIHQSQFMDIYKCLKNALTNVRADIYTPFCVDPIIQCMTIISLTNKKLLTDIIYTHLLPLYKHERLLIYFDKLTDLINRLINDNADDQIIIIKYLIKYFPHQCGQKQPLFATAIINITNSMMSRNLNPIADILFYFISMCIKSPNSKLSESALTLFMKKNIRPIIVSNYDLTIKILHEPLKWSSSFYWDKRVRDQSRVALSLLTNARFDKLRKSDWRRTLNPSDYKTMYSKKVTNQQLELTWSSLSFITAKSDRSFDLQKSLNKIKKQFPTKAKQDGTSMNDAFCLYKKNAITFF